MRKSFTRKFTSKMMSRAAGEKLIRRFISYRIKYTAGDGMKMESLKGLTVAYLELIIFSHLFCRQKTRKVKIHAF